MLEFIARVPYLVAAICGAFLAIFGVAFWGLYVLNHPINDWLLANFATKGKPLAYYLSIYSHDLAVNVVFALPFAYLLSRISPQKSWRYVWVALATAVVLQYWQLFVDPVGLNIILKAPSFYAGFFVSAVALPLAYFAVKKLRRKVNAA